MIDQIAKQFMHPPKAYSPTPIWWWSGDKLTIERLRWQMDKFVEGGVYNLVLLNLAPTGPLYGSEPDRPRFLTEEWWTIFEQVCEYADRIGIRLWFYDQIGFSGANLQGELIRGNKDFAGQSLEAVTTEGSGTLETVCPSGGTPLVALTMPINEDGQAVGEPVPVPIDGRRAVSQAAGTRRLRLIYSIERNFDYFSPEACRHLLGMVHEEIESRLSRWFGRVIVGSFQDELPDMPVWSASFAQSFRDIKGYDLLEKAVYLWEGEHAEAQRLRKDYEEVRAALAERAFFRPFYEWHERHGLLCGFDQQGPAREGDPEATVRSYADYLRTHRWYGAPGSDHHGEAKIHSSLAHLNGKERVWIEAFHSSGWGGTIEETYDWLLPWIRAGANLFNPHAAYYSTKGGWYEWAPPSTCWRQPYWRHYSLFADAISRLCYALTRGHHVCDIGILFPTSTIQSNWTLDGALAPARQAADTYRALVGKMHWVHPTPGVLDRICRDYDVLTDESIAEGAVDCEAGVLRVREESYRIILLPACTVLQAGTAEALVRFVKGGGTLLAVGALPQSIGEPEADRWIAELNGMFAAGTARHVAAAADAAAELRAWPQAVEAPVPTLHRRVGDYEMLYMTAAASSVTQIDEDSTWWDVAYSFSPGDYRRSATVVIRTPVHNMELWEPISGERHPLPTTTVEDGSTRAVVPFAQGPAVLLVWKSVPSYTERRAAATPLPPKEQQLMHELGSTWNSRLIPTLDNRFGDFDKPDYDGSPPVSTWYFDHRIGEDNASSDNWGRVQATFGTYAHWIGPCSPADLPDPADRPGKSGEYGWQPAVYSLTRGIGHDPVHIGTLGPKGHVPSEFLDFGELKQGQSVQVRTAVRTRDEQNLYIAIGAGATKQIWVNGLPLASNDTGYMAFFPIRLQPGFHSLEFRLTVTADQPLRASWAFVQEPGLFARPEWLQVPAPYMKDDIIRFTGKLLLPFSPARGTVQTAADSTCRIIVNGETIGKQGGFDPYQSVRRTNSYKASGFRKGDNTIEIELQDIGKAAGIMVDAIVESDDGQRINFVSDTNWRVRRSGMEEQAAKLWRDWKINDRRDQEPAFFHLWRRPHPLPGAEWLEEQPSGDVVRQLEIDATSDQTCCEWLRWTLPPGATVATLPLEGSAELWVDDEQVPIVDGKAHLPHPQTIRRTALLKVWPKRGRTGGALLRGPVTYETGEGGIELADWSLQGLASYSGGVQYESSVELGPLPDGRIWLDLGKVRGTAEVFVNGAKAGVCIWSPYRLDITGFVRAGVNELQITVFNTLAPYLHAVSPTHYIYPGQTVSGLFGPVRLVSK